MWRSFASVQRYEKATRTLASYHKLSSELRAYLESVTEQLEQFIVYGREVPDFMAAACCLRRPRLNQAGSGGNQQLLAGRRARSGLK